MSDTPPSPQPAPDAAPKSPAGPKPESYKPVRTIARWIGEQLLRVVARLGALGDGLEQVAVVPDDQKLVTGLLGRARRWLTTLKAKLEADPEVLMHAARRRIARDMRENRLMKGETVEPEAEFLLDDARDGGRRVSTAPVKDEVIKAVPAIAKLSAAEILAHIIADLSALAVLTGEAETRRQVASIAVEVAALLAVDAGKLLPRGIAETRLEEAIKEFCPGRRKPKPAAAPKWDGTLNSLHDRPTLSSPEGRAEWERAQQQGRRRDSG